MCSPQPFSRRKSRTGSCVIISTPLSFALPPEIVFAVVRFEIGADRQVGIECQEGPGLAIKPGDDAIGANRLQNIPACVTISQFLSLSQILFFTDRTEFRSVFVVMIEEFLSGRKTNVETDTCCAVLRSARLQ